MFFSLRGVNRKKLLANTNFDVGDFCIFRYALQGMEVGQINDTVGIFFLYRFRKRIIHDFYILHVILFFVSTQKKN